MLSVKKQLAKTLYVLKDQGPFRMTSLRFSPTPPPPPPHYHYLSPLHRFGVVRYCIFTNHTALVELAINYFQVQWKLTKRYTGVLLLKIKCVKFKKSPSCPYSNKVLFSYLSSMQKTYSMEQRKLYHFAQH